MSILLSLFILLAKKFVVSGDDNANNKWNNTRISYTRSVFIEDVIGRHACRSSVPLDRFNGIGKSAISAWIDRK